MDKKLLKSELISGKKIEISGSKSETNRLLLLQAIYPEIVIKNASDSDDSEVMKKALLKQAGKIDIHHAGTAMRFLTAFFASQRGKEVILTGSTRMKQRPIHILVQALQDLGAEISYLENEGCPPLYIKGKELKVSEVCMSADVSSQYISALLLIAPSLYKGLKINLIGEVTSAPYIKMTLALLSEIGVSSDFEGNTIYVRPLKNLHKKEITVESDWSSASYWYSFVALSAVGTCLKLSSYKEHSFQGDSILSEVYTFFGVETIFSDNEIVIRKIQSVENVVFKYDLRNAPDIAQTIAVTCFGLGIGCELTGLHTLKIKETDRLEALKTELRKLGANIEVSDKDLFLKSGGTINKNVSVETYNDHRMAMAFAPLMLKTNVIISDSEVVSKSYPNFWKDVENVIIQKKGD
ncbi:3-phosphoshikimate 1-carboxyvinyltransferase [Capnocytophaga felis]|uniref:3-phosphoshikimate 1-carboxyvinyltransferase n=1 Tax=Capnocytophaga felis TaxID=2267611 RepID=A0A5M4B6T4_9FLAO|nr:3-phosphoshikimate 1-carboxyvinyltransferase [Capnocytophaga felis]GET45238.1 3-phosphoshikimate 1-carboxyvinyltransferase [Capnocytophaga felis]GET47599.1 3-phosphoshikimate 1-carboxyvinyltransferase [Capnocytophaga felis]